MSEVVIGDENARGRQGEELWAAQLSSFGTVQQDSLGITQSESIVGEDWSQFVGEEDATNSLVGDTASSRAAGSSTMARTDSTGASPKQMVIELPPSLHPAVSEGMKRISSCYYSIHSTSSANSISGVDQRGGAGLTGNTSLADILAFLDCQNDEEGSLGSLSRHASHASLSSFAENQTQLSGGLVEDLLYHDILMNVFSFLDIDSLSAFSETGRRPNFEVFYFLQLQLQRALLLSSAPTDDHGLTPIEGTSRLARLARTEYKTAEEVVQGYLDSNTSLKQMPLSHSLEYIRQVLMRQRILINNKFNNADGTQQQHQGGKDTSLFSGAALLIALIGAASFMNSDAMTMMNVDSFMPPAAELPNMLFRVGFVGSLMSAVRSFASRNSSPPSNQTYNNNPSGGDMKQRAALMKQQAEQFANNIMHAFIVLLQDGEKLQDAGSQDKRSMTSSMRSMMIGMIRTAYATAYGHHILENGTFPMYAGSQRRGRGPVLVSSNPYDHLPPTVKEEEEAETSDDTPLSPKGQGETVSNAKEIEENNVVRDEVEKVGDNDPLEEEEEKQAEEEPVKKTPTGCVGAYRRAVSQANNRLIELVKEERLAKYNKLSEAEQRRLGTALLDACRSDDGLEDVKSIVNGGIDVEDFYFSSDGTENSPLHAAAFHGASSVLHYLCQGLEDDERKSRDGGLCQVNLRDANGWTALHFAAGTNSTKCIQVLEQHGADLSIEAANGYTPLQWAVRLQNSEVAEELREMLSKQDGRPNSKRKKKKQSLDLSRLLFDHRGRG